MAKIISEPEIRAGSFNTEAVIEHGVFGGYDIIFTGADGASRKVAYDVDAEFADYFIFLAEKDKSKSEKPCPCCADAFIVPWC